ncbi:hypothetical protein [Heyndrickxia sporothermodurans]|nr:hypothetical protein [Heyndrickxia sporothermodurans]MBL5774968.1 hypothetical protein [Heyndrickxia sporothermodurans]MBL5777647.1 hypothetical protein [Heyndrickxia sporothermodurans]MBL5781650.1 hypothetical protein [Heyndrickxia sporothermodurans]MBL5784703.1 hypothetical protein [Heyndrickxia sporothermodurans]MBL5788105.1 hypothetical protein [Heyndrickxia sporothermodurans]
MILSILVIIYKIQKNKEILRKLTNIQLVGVSLAFLLTIILSFSCIYFGGKWIRGYSLHPVLTFISQVIIIIVSMGLGVTALYKVLYKITKGILPKESE